jgi:hypothetical protein
MGGVLAFVWLLTALYAIYVVAYVICKSIRWFFVRVILDIPPRNPTYHKMIVTEAKRERLTREELNRRWFAIYPVREVPRERWPTSRP